MCWGGRSGRERHRQRPRAAAACPMPSRYYRELSVAVPGNGDDPSPARPVLLSPQSTAESPSSLEVVPTTCTSQVMPWPSRLLCDTKLGPGPGGTGGSPSRAQLVPITPGLRSIGGIHVPVCRWPTVTARTLHLSIIRPAPSCPVPQHRASGWAGRPPGCPLDLLSLSVVSPQASCVTAVHPVSSAPVLTGHQQSWSPLTASSPFCVTNYCPRAPAPPQGRPPACPAAPCPVSARPEDCTELTLWFLRCSPVPAPGPGPGRERGFRPALGEALEDLESCGQSELLRELEVQLPAAPAAPAWGRACVWASWSVCREHV